MLLCFILFLWGKILKLCVNFGCRPEIPLETEEEETLHNAQKNVLPFPPSMYSNTHFRDILTHEVREQMKCCWKPHAWMFKQAPHVYSQGIIVNVLNWRPYMCLFKRSWPLHQLIAPFTLYPIIILYYTQKGLWWWMATKSARERLCTWDRPVMPWSHFQIGQVAVLSTLRLLFCNQDNKTSHIKPPALEYPFK